jgi:hypothetical protein
VVQQAVEHGADGGRIAQQFAPVFHRSIRSQHGAGPLVAAHDDLQQFLGDAYRTMNRARLLVPANLIIIASAATLLAQEVAVEIVDVPECLASKLELNRHLRLLRHHPRPLFRPSKTN